MAHCPGCGYKLKPWNVKAECPKCGVNIPNYNWEERLEQDAQRSEWAFAKFRRSVKYLKRGLVGTKLSIVRLVFTFVPLVIFVIPAFRLTMNLPFSSFENQYVSLLDIILAIVDGIDIGALFTLMGSEIVGGAYTLFLAGFLLIALGVVSAVLNFFVLIICSVKHKYIANYVLCILSVLLFVAAIPVFIVSFQQMDAIGLPVFGGSVNAAAVCSLIGLLASYAFATPPAMPCVAIAGSSGWTTAGALVRYGFLLMLASVLICVFLGYPAACMVL